MTCESKGHFIGGKWVMGGGAEFASCGPSDGKVIWRGRIATKEEVDEASRAASLAFPLWSGLTASERVGHLRAFVENIKACKAHLADYISLEIGKPKWEAATEIGAMIGKLEPTEQAYRDRSSDMSRQLPSGMSYTRFRPHGVVAVIGPYNFPGHMPNGHIMPALLAGNTVVFKPSEYAPATSEQIVECWTKVGLPPGVLNMVQGDGSVGIDLCQDPRIRGIFFTGSFAVGESIRRHASTSQICALEMGGNSPLVVWDAVDLDAAVFATVQSAFITSGQRCSAARRLILPANEFGAAFLSRLVEVCVHLRVGRPTDAPEPYMGPLRHSGMVSSLLEQQEDMISRGAVPCIRSSRLPLGDAFVSPGILDVTPLKNRNDIEIIGPLLTVVRVADFKAAIDEANASEYGLAAGVFTEDRALYERFLHSVKAGVINWNQQLTGASAWAPFGGIKKSGNFRPSAYLAADYCVYSTASMESPQVTMPAALPPGVSLGK